ncbi:cadmium-translocating P-type ATPase [Erythrobacter sp. SCSIO 43205]|uniref:heavy metal translocating P-type ATPase n=1 Tax=Erythrobacter sp. SCSIO 43205 TaxID=2779361 RepID=UPI001CAA2286|nr:heavy metal translocating P-type ATPase [Erythrobacter sp. SCSIO 43205]UAB78898.1 cadmium-translocating P-type ATPase [Erythrobacter sp. SCSIO 43205]
MNAPVPLPQQTAAELTATRFTVPGIKCAGCIAKIERELVKVDGIASARVNFSAKRVAIEHEPNMDEASLTRALEQLGFEAQAVEENPLGADDKERTQLVRALGVAGFGMMNIMLLSVSIWSGAEGATRELFHWLSALIALPVIAYSGRPFFASALMALKHGRTNMDVPISIGVILATALSLYETATGGEHAYFESAVMLLFFLLAGRALDAVMRDKTRAGIGALLGRMGKSAQIVDEDGSTRSVAAADLEPGMIALVAAGEALAADGEVIEGASAIDNSMLTGESRPEPVATGSAVLAGAINLSAPIRVRLTATAQDTAIADIARLMDEAGQSRSSYVRIADRASRAYAPAVHSLAALAFVGWMVAGAGWYQSLVIAIAVLIITCPCAMGLAVPTAQVVASGALLKRGLLVKDGSALERLAECDSALMDKTGTLTVGEPVPQIDDLSKAQKSVALALAQSSSHPLSKGLAKTLRAAGVEPAILIDVTEVSGEGMRGIWRGQNATLGRPKNSTDELQPAGLSTQLTIGEFGQTIAFNDPLRCDAAATLDAMRALGMEAAIVSGDRSAAVDAVANTLGIKGFGDASPKEKLEMLDQLKGAGHKPLMVGDGLNDGPALAAAHASIAPGTASDASKQAADAVFLGEKLMPVALAVKAARATMRIVRQNFGFSILYNALAVPLALFGYVTPLIAAIAMSVSSLVVVANSLRLNGAAK